MSSPLRPNSRASTPRRCASTSVRACCDLRERAGAAAAIARPISICCNALAISPMRGSTSPGCNACWRWSKKSMNCLGYSKPHGLRPPMRSKMRIASTGAISFRSPLAP
ncbi:UNVERIFIED_CONTAM: hypothetical protein GTU68_005285 [Idotea baltica]|nr:hypothetical protein [Idotea baltica]